jgi:hypothetical protein
MTFYDLQPNWENSMHIYLTDVWNVQEWEKQLKTSCWLWLQKKKNISEHNASPGIHEITEMLNYSRPRVEHHQKELLQINEMIDSSLLLLSFGITV